MTDDTETRHHEPLRSNARIGGSDVKEVQRDGRTYLTFPVIAAREMVMNYPEDGTRELLPAEKIRETADLWSGTSIAYLHPQNETQSAQTANAYTSTVIGQAHDPEVVSGDRLRVNAWIDVEKAEAIGGMAADVVNALRSGEELPVSAAYTTIGDRRVNGEHDGESYDVEQGTPIPDHIAIFPSDAPFQARCSPEDGCAAPRANAVADGGVQTPMNDPASGDSPPDPTTIQRVLNYISPGGGEEREHDCDCGGSCDDCRHKANTAPESESGGDPSEATGDDPDADEAGAEDGSNEPEDTNNMSNERIEALAEESTFDVETLGEWSDDELEALENTIDQHSESTDAETTETETEPAETEEPAEEAEPVTANAEELVEQIADEMESRGFVTEDDLSEREKRNSLRPDAEVVANARDDLTVEEALEMPEGVLQDLAEEERTANFAGVPGPKDRTPDAPEDEAEEYPGGSGFSDWKQNAEAE